MTKVGVSALFSSKVPEQELLEKPERRLKYLIAKPSTVSSTNLHQLIDLLMEQDRIWNISSFSYSKSGDEDYTASLNFDLYYRIDTNE